MENVKIQAEGQGQYRGITQNKTHGGFNLTIYIPQEVAEKLEPLIKWPLDTPLEWALVQIPQD